MWGVASVLTRRREWHESQGGLGGGLGRLRGNRAICNGRLCYADGVSHEDARARTEVGTLLLL